VSETGEESGLELSGLSAGASNALRGLAHARARSRKSTREGLKSSQARSSRKRRASGGNKEHPRARKLRWDISWSPDDGLAFVTRRWFTNRVHRIPFAEMEASRWKRGLLLNRFGVETAKGDREFYVFKDVNVQEAVVDARATQRSTAVNG
jgi:hypothetical protein